MSFLIIILIYLQILEILSGEKKYHQTKKTFPHQ